MNAKIFIIAIICSSALSAAIPDCKAPFPAKDNRGTGCMTCKAGFLRTAVKKTNADVTAYNCVACVPKNCSECDSTLCITCNMGFYKTSAGICEPMKVANCATADNDGKCQTCKMGFKLFTTDDKQECVKLPSHCSDLDEKKMCSSCESGWRLKKAPAGVRLEFGQQTPPTCEACSTGCTNCDDNVTVCKTCNSGFFQVTAQLTVGQQTKAVTCSPCTAHCQDCENADFCKSCLSGYVQKETPALFKFNQQTKKNTCVACVANCFSCSGDSTCETCMSGFNRSDDGKACTKVKCPGNCSTCSTAEKCSKCNSGFFRTVKTQTGTSMPTGVVCDKCGDRCNVCESAEKCWTCSSLSKFDPKNDAVCIKNKSAIVWIIVILVLLVLGCAVGFFFWKKKQDGEGDYNKEDDEQF